MGKGTAVLRWWIWPLVTLAMLRSLWSGRRSK